MAKRILRHKVLFDFIDWFTQQSTLLGDDRHIDGMIYSSVPKSRWRNLLFELYKEGEEYLKRNSLDVKIGIYACIRVYPIDSKKKLSEIDRFYFDYKCMPPCILLYRWDFNSVLKEPWEFAPLIAKKYGMMAYLRHDKEDPYNQYYLCLG